MTDCVAIIATIYEEFGRGNIPALVELLAADVKWERWADNTAQTSGVPWLLERDGKSGEEAFFQDYRQIRVFTQEVEDHGYGFVTYFKVPGGFKVQLYEPKYAK
jgi:hypothetical protein